MKQQLSQKQKHKLSPQQMQLVKFIELPTAFFEERLNSELEENPSLEKVDPIENLKEKETESNIDDEKEDNVDFSSLEQYVNDDEPSYYSNNPSGYNKETNSESAITNLYGKNSEESLISFFALHLSVLNLSEEETEILEFLLGSIDNEGYLRRENNQIVGDILFSLNLQVTEEQVEALRQKIMEVDNLGIGSRNLQEMLVYQLDKEYSDNALYEKARVLLLDYFDRLAKKHYEIIEKRLKIDRKQLQEIVELIQFLNPKPGLRFGSETVFTDVNLTPDFIITLEQGEIFVDLYSNYAPNLRVSQDYKDMVNHYSKVDKMSSSEKSALVYMKKKIESAKWFIEAVMQRQRTLLKTMRSIVNFQREYFLTGDLNKIKPMILRNIAEDVEMDLSTISRVVSSKYAQTPYGLILLKNLFSESITKTNGEISSSIEVKNLLQEYIESEDRNNPYNDETLTEYLKNRGYDLARRTIAKYREKLGVPPSRLRKKL